LRELYHRAGISEYWLIDARGEDINFQILVRRAKGYQRATVRDGWWRSQVFNRWFRLVRRRDRMGQWQYRLELKLAVK
jgi:Uma2 family endonuclease